MEIYAKIIPFPLNRVFFYINTLEITIKCDNSLASSIKICMFFHNLIEIILNNLSGSVRIFGLSLYFGGRIILSSIKPPYLMFHRQNLTLYLTYHVYRSFVLMLATFNDL